jgi:hypothetical protein
MAKGYARHYGSFKRVVSRLYGVPKKTKPKKKPQPYQRAAYPGQKVQIDVKYVPGRCVANGQRYASYFADDIEGVLPIVQSILEEYGVPASRIEFLAMTRDDLIDPAGVIRWVSVNGDTGLYSDLSWERNILLDNVPWSELPRRLVEHVEDIEITLMTPGGYRTGIYTGDIFEGVPNGNGSFTSRNPEGIYWTYTGAFRDGLFHGEGVQEWDSGSRREGTFLYGDLHGGHIYHDDGTLAYRVESGEWIRMD